MSALDREPDDLVTAEVQAVERVVRSGRWVLGPEVEQFERAWAAEVGATHAVGVGNGTDALEIGLSTAGIGPGDEVITSGMTAFATIAAIIRAGASPVLADIDPSTAQLHAESVLRCLSPSTRAVVHVHLYGRAGPVDEFRAICVERGILLVEDCAQAHGARVGGQSVGTFGHFASWSFYPTKNLGAVGDAGAVSTSDPDLARRIRMARDYGRSDRDHHELVGRNSRLDELQAAILGVRLQRLPSWTAARRRIAEAYRAGIRHPLVTPMPSHPDPAGEVHHLFVIRTARPEDLQRHLGRHDIDSLAHYRIPAHLQPAGAGLRTDPGGLTATEAHARACLSIPCHHGLDDKDIGRVIAAVNSLA